MVWKRRQNSWRRKNQLPVGQHIWQPQRLLKKHRSDAASKILQPLGRRRRARGSRNRPGCPVGKRSAADSSFAGASALQRCRHHPPARSGSIPPSSADGPSEPGGRAAGRQAPGSSYESPQGADGGGPQAGIRRGGARAGDAPARERALASFGTGDDLAGESGSQTGCAQNGRASAFRAAPRSSSPRPGACANCQCLPHCRISYARSNAAGKSLRKGKRGSPRIRSTGSLPNSVSRWAEPNTRRRHRCWPDSFPSKYWQLSARIPALPPSTPWV